MNLYLNDSFFNSIDGRINSCHLIKWFFSPAVLSFFYGIYLFLYEIKFLRDIIPVIHPVLIIWAAVVIFYAVFFRKVLLSTPYWKILFCFFLSMIVSVILNITVNPILSLKSWVMAFLPLALFYISFFQYGQNERESIFIKVMIGASVVVFIASLVALIMFLLRYSAVVSFLGGEQQLGIRLYDPSSDNNAIILYGIYVDTNHAAAYSLIFAFYSLVLFFSCRKNLFRLRWQNLLGQFYAVLNFFTQIFYFPLANSRGGWLTLGITIFILIFLFVFHRIFLRHNMIFRFISVFVISIICVCFVTCLLIGLRSGVSEFSISLSNYLSEINSNNEISMQQIEEGLSVDQSGYIEKNTDSSQNQSDSNVDIDNSIEVPVSRSIDEFEKKNQNFGSNRFQIWQEVFQVFGHKPVFGICSGNSSYYAVLYNEGVRLSNGDAVHNSYFDLLLDYGLVGFVFLMLFFLFCAKKVLCKFWSGWQSIGTCWYFVLGIVSITLCSAVLLSCMFISTTAMYFSLLMATGSLVAIAE